MITNVDLAVEFIAKWLADYAKNNNRKEFIIINSMDCKDSVLNYVCSETTKFHGGLTLYAVEASGYSWIDAHIRAENYSGIVVGSIDRSNGFLARNYRKIQNGTADVFPFYDLEYSDICQIGSSVFPGRYDITEEDRMLEYCNHIESLYGIITNENPPHTHPRWPYFLSQQKEYIAKVWEREKRTRHKALDHKPFPTIPAHICRRSAR